MRKIGLFLLVFMVTLTSLWAAEWNIEGVWVSNNGKTTYEILGGLKPNRGPLIVVESGIETNLGSWKYKDDTYYLKTGWFESEAKFQTNDMFTYNYDSYKRSENIEENNIISIKDDEKGFIDMLTSYSWTDGDDRESVLFHTTFSNDSGVQERFDADGSLNSFRSWSVGSGVMKIGSTVLVDCRISDRFMIGVDSDDNFALYKRVALTAKVDKTNLKEEREKFLDELTTDSWFQKSYYNSTYYVRFRPIESELKGRLIETKDKQLYSWCNWEYSPETGTIKIGYTTYPGAVVVGDTLAFIKNNGDQEFYRRVPGGENHRFTVSDVTNVALSETNIPKISKILEGQFQYDDYIYNFEFSENKPSGYVHKFITEPFNITGNKFSNDLIGDSSEQLWTVEDVVIFGERSLLKRDTQKVWMRPMSDEEANIVQSEAEQTTEMSLNKNVVVRVRTKDGRTIDVDLPIADFSEIADMTIVVE